MLINNVVLRLRVAANSWATGATGKKCLPAVNFILHLE